MLRVRWGWLLPVVAGLAVGVGMAAAASPPRRPTSVVGPAAFVKYGENSSNNPVVAADRFRGDWTFSAKEPLQQASIAHGVIYASGDGDMAGGQDHRIYAVDAKTGHLLWSTRLDNMSMTTPVVLGNRVYVGSGTQQFRGRNVVEEGVLPSTGIVRGTGASAIYALDPANGRVVWKDKTRGEDMPSFVATRRALYVANGQGRVYALQPSTGAVLWSVPIGSYVSMASPTLSSSGLLYVSGAHPYRVYAINTHTHRIQWSRSLPKVFAGSDDSSPALAHDTLYLEGTTGGWRHPSSAVFALSAQSGRIRWSRRLGQGPLPQDIEVSAPVVAHHRIYVGSPITHREYALSSTNGRVVWQFQAVGPVSESAAVTRRTLYVGDGAGFLYALNPETGQERGSLYIGGSLAADYPLVVGGTLIQPDENGLLLAMPRERLLASYQRRQVPAIPLPAGQIGQQILQGEALFYGQGLTGRSCASCHLAGGSVTTVQKGAVMPTLLGVASGFPRAKGHQLITLDDQINRCLAHAGGQKLASQDPRLADLNLYLHWLSSGWRDNLGGHSGPAGGKGGGC
ncbi:PQQ-binding-like beta-propeller repeat protein [Sulfobacillus harzensis]|uniref:PQQ-binding-like beta-propeller repeat protein n=1 Tax=Sulfobacillus harzensis TaxID=2729629 RepID=A0A7Y0Q1P3_9FIRM|nr:PQQ-binding-like beta-propeller repeat protein [Sulfobacillus harzensis]NMP21046.1 PQQ-binding-like beta-propeller repeat protein [Sulfobacillus harzensis]